jgi:hypothetical protein
MSLVYPSFPILLNSFNGSNSLTVGTSTLCTGTNFQPGAMAVGNRFRVTANVGKTAAGAATWSINLRYGSANTNADTSIFSATSGTNTALADKGQLTIDLFINSIAASGSVDIVFMNRSFLNIANFALGTLATSASTSSNTIDTTQTANWIGLYVTAGTGATMTSTVGMAERLS